MILTVILFKVGDLENVLQNEYDSWNTISNDVPRFIKRRNIQ